jgi:ADP-heptose:LPS heptosyltransferase
MSPGGPQRILVIKLSALGDFVMSIGAFQAIRRHHGGAEIVLLTTGPYGALAEASGCFDEIWLDERPGPFDFRGWGALARRLRQARFARVYDLQRSERTAWYFRLLAGAKPEWVGVVAGCSHRYQPPPDRALHIVERQATQLAVAGIQTVAPPDLGFLQADVGRFGLPGTTALLVPGGAPHRPAKRWPAERFAGLARSLTVRGVIPVLIGGAAEREIMTVITAACPEAQNLCGKTDLAEIVSLARRARIAVGNDTGPMHLIAAAGCPVISLFSAESDPAKVAPRGPSVKLLARATLADLPIDEVLAAARTVLSKHAAMAKSRLEEDPERAEEPPYD